MSNLIYKWASKYVDYKNKQQEAKTKILNDDSDRLIVYIKSFLNSFKIQLIKEFEKSGLRNIKPGDILLVNDYNYLDSRNRWDSGVSNLLHYKVDQHMPSYVRVKSIGIATDYYDYLVNEYLESLSYENLKHVHNQGISINEFNKFCNNTKKTYSNQSFFKGVLYRKIEFEAYENFIDNIKGHAGMSEYTFLCKDDLEYNLTKEVLASEKTINNYVEQIDMEYEKREKLIKEYKEKIKK